MMERDRKFYLKYKESAPFMFPIPKTLTSIFTAPIRLFLKKTQPENGKEIVFTFLIYFLVFVLLSLPFILLDFPPDHQ